VSLSRGNGITGPPRLQSLAAHRRAVTAIVEALAPYRNWYLDLSNERNLKDKRHTTFAELAELRALVRKLDAERLVTASHAGDASRDEVREYALTVGVDFLTPHRPRHAASAGQTEAKTGVYLQWLKELGRVVPVHYQEPFRRGFGKYDPTAQDFLADLAGARRGSAAGWCLHNGDQRDRGDGRPRRSFDLREGRLFEQLDAVEREVLGSLLAQTAAPARRTEVAIKGDAFHINGRPTYAGRTWQGKRVEGLLFNSRMVQATFDDLNPETRSLWAYPDTGKWDAERNVREFLAAMPEWRKQGLLAMTLNLQGGSPQGYSKGKQPWHNSALTEGGELRPEFMARFERILDRADELGMVVMLGVFYFGQDERLKDEAAVLRGLDGAVDWVLQRGYRHVLIEVNNECNVRYDHAILKPERVHELIERVKTRTRDGRRLLVSTSYGGGTIPRDNVVRSSDFLLLHGNGVSDPARIAAMVRQTRQVAGYRAMPILFNEDDHFDFDKPRNNMLASLDEYCSWGYFDPGKNDYADGFQSPPVQWRLTTPRKQAFFAKLREITGE
jgi:hypothetical protein